MSRSLLSIQKLPTYTGYFTHAKFQGQQFFVWPIIRFSGACVLAALGPNVIQPVFGAYAMWETLNAHSLIMVSLHKELMQKIENADKGK